MKRWAVGVLLAAFVASGCQATAQSSDPATPATATATEPVTPPAPPMKYVALGDSYTAAPHQALPQKIRGCMRSKDNYPSLVAEELDATLRDVSCSGASTSSMFTEQNFDAGGSQPPQLSSVTAEATMVTLGVGANDFRFFYSMVYGCLARAKTNPDGAPCHSHNTRNGPDRLANMAKRIQPRIEKVINQIRNLAPHATVVLVGYPQLVPGHGRCHRRLPLAKLDYDYVRRTNKALARAVAGAARDTGVHLADLYAASHGHDICSDEPWVAGVRGADNRAQGLHPYPAEQRAAADLIVELAKAHASAA